MELYEDSDEEAIHLLAIESLAEETQQPIDLVRRVYENEFARLKGEAKVKHYLPLFTSRRTRESLLRQRR